jgi:hypothetical protein
MSIALTAKVADLERMLTETTNQLIDAQARLTEALERIAILEQTCARKPGPKGNHNG